jgi:starvation-inducible DNA-binding protein
MRLEKTDEHTEERVRTVAQTLETLRIKELQPFEKMARMPIALDEKACLDNARSLNQLLADTMTLRDLYKKHHWQTSGRTFYQLHLLFDKHAGEQSKLVDLLAERIQTLGGVTLAMASDVAEITQIPRAPKGRESASAQLARLLHTHEIILKEARVMARLAAGNEDVGTNDILVSDVICTNELQVWFVSQHLSNV